MADPRAQIEISAVDRTQAAFTQIKRSLEGLDAPFMRINQALGVISGGALAGFAGAMLRAAEQAEQSTARMNAVLKATGNQSGFTAKQLEALADQMSRATQFDDEAFRDATAQILKFGNVAGEQFKKLLSLSADYAALNKTDVASAAETLGRALASPSQGIERLQRSIGYLNPAIVESIRQMEQMGDVLGAQDKILKLIEERIGGTAGEMNKGLTGSVRAFTKAFLELLEVGGNDSGGVVGANLDFISQKLRALKNFFESEKKLVDFIYIMAGLPAGGPLEAMRRFDVLGDRQAQVGGFDPNAPTALADRKWAESQSQHERNAMEEIVKLNEWLAREQKRIAEEAAREKERLRQADMAGWVAYIEEMERKDIERLQAEEKRLDELYAHKEKLRKDDERALLEGLDKQREAEEEAMRRAADFPSQTEIYVKTITSLWDEASSRGADFFNDLVFSGEQALDVLRRHLKSFAADLIAIFTKKWILQLGAAALGSTSLGAMAAGVGEGTLAGSLGNFLGIGNLFTGGSGGALGWLGSSIGGSFGGGLTMASQTGMLSGFTNGAGMLAGGNALAGVGSMLPGIGALVAVGSLLYSMFKGGPENPNFRIFQGTGGAGAFGGISTQGNFSMGSGWDQLLAYVGGLDTRFSRLLGPEGSAAASAQLAAYTGAGLRADGQPAQFAIPPGAEREGAEQVAKELLQSRYGILFEGIDKGIAEQIRAWSGTSTDLQAFIEQMLSIIEGLSGSGIKGLDIAALRAMQREGESLGDTFQRVGQQWATFNDLFTTEAERLTAAQDLIAKTFADLGMHVPASAQAFEDLVRGLDLSTEAGRKMFEALLEVAPAFSVVSRAAEQAWQDVQSIIGRITGTSSGPGAFNAAIAAFQAGSPGWAGVSAQAIVDALLTITQEDFANYSAANQQLITQILTTYESMGNLSTAASAAATGLASIGEMVPGNQYGTKMGIQQFLQSLLTGGELSPLTLEQRTANAGSEFQRLLARAKAGDWAAMELLQGSAQTYLGLAREQFASGPAYNAIYQAVFTGLQQVSGFDRDWQGQLVNAGAATNEKLDLLNGQLSDLLALIAGGQSTGDTAVAEAVRDSARAIVDAIGQTESGLVTS